MDHRGKGNEWKQGKKNGKSERHGWLPVGWEVVREKGGKKRCHLSMVAGCSLLNGECMSECLRPFGVV
jgi:hypothetical protein